MNIDPQQIVVLIILVGAVVLLFTEWIAVDQTAMLILVTLAATRILDPDEALSGFSSEPAIMLASIFVLSSALYHTGFSARVGTRIARVAGSSYHRILAVTMSAVSLLSAFTHHVTMTAVMLPVVMRMSKEHAISPSRLLMPVSFAASLGTTITIIGAPAFLIADGLLRTAGRPGLGLLSIAPIGLAISTAGVILMLLFGRLLLPDNPSGVEAAERFRLEQYYTELILLEESTYIGRTISEIEADEEEDFRVVNWLRRGRAIPRPFGDACTQQGDVLLVRTTPEKIATVGKERGIALHPLHKFGEEVHAEPSNGDEANMLMQTVVAPGSELVGNTIGRVDFLHRYGVLVVGVWRRKGWMQTELARLRLRDGDVLVLMGDEDAFTRVADDRSFLMMVPFQGEPSPRSKQRLAALIMAAAVVASAFNLLSVEIALLAGALATVLSGCLTPRQAYQSIDVRIYVFIAGAIPLGIALEKTGTAALLAGWLESVVSGWNPSVILLALFAVSGLMTQVMSDAATVALLGPVALALAQLLGTAPEPFVVTVAMASVASFLTPIGHHGNLLIYAPGRYRFKDFIIAGLPLTIIVAIIVALLAPILWPN